MLQSLEGRGFGPYPLRVVAEQVADFVAATSDDAPRWNQYAPPGWVAVCLFAVAPDLLNAPALAGTRVIHGEQRFKWLQPFPIGSTLTVTGEVTRVRDRGGVHFIGFDLNVARGEEQVAGGSSTFLVSGEAPAGGESDEEAEPPAETGDLASNEPFIRSVSRAGLIKYAAATRDWNPIHWDHESARAAGLPGVVAHGLLQAAWMMSFASSLRADPAPVVEAAFRFRAPLRPTIETKMSVQVQKDALNARLNSGAVELVNGRMTLR